MFKTLLFLCLFITISNAFPTGDSKYCSLGPLYTCQAVNVSHACNAFDHCKSLWKQGVSSVVETLNEFECQLCEIVMTDLKNALRSKATEKDIVDAVEKLCLKIPQTNVQHACQLMATAYLQSILNMLGNDIEPQVVCRTVHMCPGPAYMPQNLTSLMSLSFHLQRHKQSPAVAYSSDPTKECTDCKKFMSDLRERYIGNATRQNVEDYLNSTFCPLMPCQPMRVMCEHAVQYFVDDIVKLLREQFDPETDCILIGFCSKGDLLLMRQSLLRLISQYPTKLPATFTSDKCDICKDLVQKGMTLLDQPNVQERLTDLLKTEFCSTLVMIRYECERYITIYIPVIVRVLRNTVSPTELCQELDACPTPKFFTFSKFYPQMVDLRRRLNSQQTDHGNRMPSLIKATPTIDENIWAKSFVGSPMSSVVPTCEFCKLVIEAVERRLPIVRTEAAAVKAMEEVCLILPTPTGKRCDDFVKLYGPKVAKLLVEFVAPHLICMSLELCPMVDVKQPVLQSQPKMELSNAMDSNTIVFNAARRLNPSISFNAALDAQRPVSGNTFLCTLCKSIVTRADQYLKENSTDEEVENRLDTWCRTLAQAWSTECINLVHQYTPIILEILAADADPARVCTKLELCAAQNTNEVLREKALCTFGASYWCSSLLTAHRCQATNYCQKKVWLGKVLPKSMKTPTA